MHSQPQPASAPIYNIGHSDLSRIRRLPRGVEVSVGGRAVGRLVGVTPHGTVWVAWRPRRYDRMVERFDTKYPGAAKLSW